MKNLKNYAPSRVSKREQSVVEGAKILDLLAVAIVKKTQIGTNARKSAKASDAHGGRPRYPSSQLPEHARKSAGFLLQAFRPFGNRVN
jgi:hypothetical protein